MTFIPVGDGTRLRVDTSGDGRPLVLISGLGGTAGFWSNLVEALGSSLHAVRFDQRGIAGSGRGAAPVTIDSLAQDSWDIIDTLKLDQPILCGHSTGGAIVQQMVLMRPGMVPGIVLSGSWAGPDKFMQQMFELRLDLLNTAPERYAALTALMASPPRWQQANPQAVQKAIDHVPQPTNVVIIQERIRALLSHDCRNALPDVSTPALILGAEDDMIVPPYLQEELASLLPNAQLQLLDHGGHFYPVTRPGDTAELLQRWLQHIES
jgi:aminoacrylate hydrolase